MNNGNDYCNSTQTKKRGRPRKQKIVFSLNDVKIRALTNKRPVIFYSKDIYPAPFILITEKTDMDLFAKMKGNRDAIAIIITDYELGKIRFMYNSHLVELKSTYQEYRCSYIGKHFRFFAKTSWKDVNSLVFSLKLN